MVSTDNKTTTGIVRQRINPVQKRLKIEGQIGTYMDGSTYQIFTPNDWQKIWDYVDFDCEGDIMDAAIKLDIDYRLLCRRNLRVQTRMMYDLQEVVSDDVITVATTGSVMSRLLTSISRDVDSVTNGSASLAKTEITSYTNLLKTLSSVRDAAAKRLEGSNTKRGQVVSVFARLLARPDIASMLGAKVITPLDLAIYIERVTQTPAISYLNDAGMLDSGELDSRSKAVTSLIKNGGSNLEGASLVERNSIIGLTPAAKEFVMLSLQEKATELAELDDSAVINITPQYQNQKDLYEGVQKSQF